MSIARTALVSKLRKVPANAKKFVMLKITILAVLLTTFACNNKENGTARASVSDNTAKATSSSWTKNDEMQFIDGCLDQSAAKLGDDKAFNHCKCILRQLEQKNPQNDSLVSEKLMNDTAEVARMLANCK